MGKRPSPEALASMQKRQLPLVYSKPEEAKMVRLLPSVNGSMSKTDLLLKCQYWASPTVITVPEPTEISALNFPLRFGRGFHKCMEIHLDSRGLKKPKFTVIAEKFSVDPKRLEDFYRRAKEFIDPLLKKRGWDQEEYMVEKKMVYDPFNNQMRFLESTKERDYSNKKSTEFPGTGDLAIPLQGKRPFMVLDWKSGQSTYDAQDNGQLLSLSLGLSRHLQNFEAVVFIVRIDEDFIEPSEGLLTSKMLDEHRENLRLAIQNALSKNPSMRMGTHCSKYYCPALDVCPAHAGPLSLRDMIDGVLSPEQRGHQYTRYQNAKKLLDRIGDFWHRDVEMNGPILGLDNGDRVELKESTKENLSKASIRRAMNLVDAQAIIQQLDDAGAVERHTEKRLTPVRDPASKKPR